MKNNLLDTRERGWWWASNSLVDDGWLKRMGPHSFAVYVSLLRAADGGGFAFPSIDFISEQTGVSRRQVIRGLQHLMELNLVKKVRKGGPNSGSSVYQILDLPSQEKKVKPRPPEQVGEIEQEAEAKLQEAQFFETAWDLYPSRPGNNKTTARRAWTARMKLGVDPVLIVEGVKRYAAYVTREKTEPQFIKQAATFFGPDEWYLLPWTSDPVERPWKEGANNGPKLVSPEKGLLQFYSEEEVV